MRITFIAPHAGYSGGIRVIATHARRLDRRGHQVLVVVATPAHAQREGPTQARRQGSEEPAWMSDKGGHFDGVPVEHRVLNKIRAVTDADVPDADVIVATWWETAEWVSSLSPRKGAKVFFIQGDETELCKDDRARERLAATWRLPMTKVAVAGWLVRLGQQRCPGHEIALVQNSVDLDHFRAPPRGKQAIPSVGMIFSNAPVKGADLMRDAYRRAKERIANLRLVAFGDAPTAGGPAWPQDVPIEIRPAQDRIPSLYASCDAWLFGTRREGFGLPILEAMACRTPVIGTPAGAGPRSSSLRAGGNPGQARGPCGHGRGDHPNRRVAGPGLAHNVPTWPTGPPRPIPGTMPRRSSRRS